MRQFEDWDVVLVVVVFCGLVMWCLWVLNADLLSLAR